MLLFGGAPVGDDRLNILMQTPNRVSLRARTLSCIQQYENEKSGICSCRKYCLEVPVECCGALNIYLPNIQKRRRPQYRYVRR